MAAVKYAAVWAGSRGGRRWALEADLGLSQRPTALKAYSTTELCALFLLENTHSQEDKDLVLEACRLEIKSRVVRHSTGCTAKQCSLCNPRLWSTGTAHQRGDHTSFLRSEDNASAPSMTSQSHVADSFRMQGRKEGRKEGMEGREKGRKEGMEGRKECKEGRKDN